MPAAYSKERLALLRAARAGHAFHQALEACGADPARSRDYTSPAGLSLDSLYAAWQQANTAALSEADEPPDNTGL